MKVICKCCHKAFDYDMYMGLCPKCGRVYRRGKEHYSAVEKDMAGDFHLHGEEGGLNRGISGVVYNQGSDEKKILMKNGFDEDDEPQNKYVREVNDIPAAYATAANASQGRGAKMVHSGVQPSPGNVNSGTNNYWAVNSNQKAANQQMMKQQLAAAMNSRGNGYYSPDHKTKLNQQVVRRKKGNPTIGFIIFIIIIILSFLSSMFD